MQIQSLKKVLTGATLVATAANFTSCGGGGSSSTWGTYSSPYATASGFVSGLNSADNASILDESFVELYADETLRSAMPGEEDWFVIYDGKYDEYKAVSLQYIRSIVYYAYYSNNTDLAEEFRAIETDDILNGDLDGDFWGDDYEVVDHIGLGVYRGRNSTLLYEDEEETTDVALLAAEKEFQKFAKKAAKVSFAYKVSLDSAAKLVNIGSKAEKMLKKGDLTLEDQRALVGELESFAGVSLTEVIEAGQNPESKNQIIEEIADNIGTTGDNLRNRIMPKLLNIQQ